MSASGLSGKQHGDKSTVSGKRYQSVNINSVYSGKSLVSQKSSAPTKHGLQSLGKASAVARRMPPPANLPSLKSESAGQDPTVHLVPSGVSGWGNTQQPQDSRQPQSNDPLPQSSKINQSDAVSLRPAGVLATPTSSSSAVSGSTTSSTSSNRQTWSTRIGGNSATNVTSATAVSSATALSTAAGFFSSHSAQEFPKLAHEIDSIEGTGGPSLRPQKAGSWKAGGVKASASAADVISTFGQNGQDSSSSSESPAPHHSSISLVPPQTSQRPASAPQPPHQTVYPYSMPPPPHPPNRQGAPFTFPYPPYGMYPPPPPSSAGARYAPNYGGYAEKNNSYAAPSRMPPSAKDGRGPIDDGYGGSRGSGPPSSNYPPHRGQPMLSRPPPGLNSSYDRDLPPSRMSGGEHWPNAYPREAPLHPPDNSYDDRGVWSDNEVSERDRDRRYRHDQRMKLPPAEEHAWSDSDDRYGRDYDYEEHWQQQQQHGPPMRQMPENRGFPPMYGAPLLPNAPRDGRFVPPPPPHPNYGYMNYDHRQMPPPPMFPPHVSYAVRDPCDLEAEEQEELLRQRKQQHARDAAIERSRQKRLLAQQVSISSGGASEQSALNEDPYYVAGAQDSESEPDRPSSRESGSKGTRRHPVPPRFVRKPDGRYQPPPMVSQPPHYANERNRPYRSVPNQNSGYDYNNRPQYVEEYPNHPTNARSSGGDYYNRFSYDNNNGRRYKEMPSKSDNRHESIRLNEKEDQSALDRDFPEEQIIAKPLKRPDSKESLSSHSDRSSHKTEKLPVVSRAGGSSAHKWPAEDTLAKEQAVIPSVEEEDEHKFETLAKPKVVKRTVGVSEKPKEQAPVKEGKETIKEVQRQSQTKKETQLTPASGEATTSSDKSSSSKQNPVEEPQQNIWQKRKEQLEKQKENTSFTDEFSDQSYHSRKDHDPGIKQRGETKRDQFGTHNYLEGANWNAGRTSSRGRAMTRGRVRREFVSSRRNQGGSSLSTAHRERRRDNGGSRRVGSVPWDDRSAYYQEKTDHSKGDGDYIQRKPMNEKSFAEEHHTDNSSRSLTPDAKVVSGVQEAKRSPVNDEGFDTKRVSPVKEDSHDKGDGDYSASQVRPERPRHSSNSKRGNHRADVGDYYSNKGYYSQSRSRGRTSSSIQNSYNKRYYGTTYEKPGSGGGKYSQQQVDIDEFDPNQLKDAGFSSEFTSSNQTESKSTARGRGSRRGGGIPPRFSNRGGNNRHYDNYYSGSGTGSYTHGRQSFKSGYNQSASNAVGAHSASSAKSPTGQRDNQSEGNDEWETASESSDVGRPRKSEKKDDNSDKKRPSANAPKSFSAQRRNNNNESSRNTGGGGSSTNSNQLVWGPNSGTNRRNNNSTTPYDARADNQQDYGSSVNMNYGEHFNSHDNKNRHGPKNATAASHQAPYGVDRSISVMQHPASNQNNQTAATLAKKTAKKEEKPASKTDALATVNLNNIAGVVVIDDQPDIVSVADSQEGFQEVLSKKERRNRKDLHQQDDGDRKSQSPKRSTTKLQPRNDSVGSKPDKEGVGVNALKKQSHNGGANSQKSCDSSGFGQHFVSVTSTNSNNIDVRPSSPSAIGSPWDRKSTNQTAATGTVQNNPSPKVSVSMAGADQLRKTAEVRSTMGGVATRDDSISSSRTGVEIWGTPDPVPFSGAANEQQSKCVVRPSKHGENSSMQIKSVEFVAEGFNNATEDPHVKIDFTFDADLVSNFNAAITNEKQGSANNVGKSLDAQQQSHPLTSPSTDQLSEKIASVKKVWDNQMMDESNPSIEDAFYSAATDAQSAAIAGAAFSMSQAVLHSDQSSYDSDGMKSNDGMSGVNVVQSVTSVPSSKTEGPNVAKVRPQQMRVVETFTRQGSYTKMEDSVIGGGPTGMYAPPMSSPTAAMYGSPNNLLFSSYPPQINGKQAQTQQNVDPFAASVRPPYLYQQMNGQNQMVIAPQAQIDPAAFGNPYRANAQSTFSNADQYAFTVGVQPVRPNVGQGSIFTSKSSTNAGTFLMQDAGASLFSQPPPPLNAAPPQSAVMGRASQQPPLPQQQASNVFPFAQPSVAPPPLIQPFGGQGFGGTTKYGQNSTNSGNFVTSKSSGLIGQPYNNWSTATNVQNPSVPTVGGKVFNPTIGPPNPQQKSGPGGGNFNTAAALINLISASGNAPPPFPNQSVPAGTTNLGMPTLYVRNSNRNAVGGGIVKQQQPHQVGSVQNATGGDSSKRDGELLQHIDNFINSTGGEDESPGSLSAVNSNECSTVPMSKSSLEDNE